MAITAVQDWLTGNGSFAKGVELLKSHGRPTSTDLFLFSTGESPFARQKLTAALTAVNNASTERILHAPLPMAKAIEVDVITSRAFDRGMRGEAGQDVSEEMLPASMRPLRKQARDLHRHLVHLRATMLAMPDGMELRHTAEKIVSLRKQLNSVWRCIEEWRVTGIPVFPHEAKAEAGQNDLVRELNSLNVQLSKAKHGKSKAPADKVAAWEARKAAIKTMLNREDPA